MIPTLRTFSIAFALLAVALAPAAFAGDSIDFTKAPAQGAKFKVTDTVNADANMEIEGNGQTFAIQSKTTVKKVFSHKILEVKDGKITLIEREYEDAGMKQVVQAPMFPEPQEKDEESPLAWKVIRAKWNDDALELEVKDGDDWKAAEEKIANEFTAASLRSPLLPLPDGSKEVGESWELDSDAVKAFFPSKQFGGSDGSEMSGEFKATLKSIQEVDGLECGVIEFTLKLTIETGEGQSTSLNLKGTAHYSTKYRFVIKTDAGGKMTSEFEGEQQGVSVSRKVSGDLKLNTTATPVTDE